ncbi:D-amino acid aminotransferase [Thiomicrorhabdus aquaedulcis]|uniref:D-amino acid aminotransferase n=1 Tax=Thiomicrorhabdus aquaedulcis TaxID=2211106 RepID=UPI000FD82313|nr:D-amino acid aminotransferase [Thiomicrorhabdus aquaedulcis]
MLSQTVTEQIVYLNGLYLPMCESQISTQDRGFLFGDGVYEVIPVYERTVFSFDEHLARLKNSLKATSIPNPLTDAEWLNLLNTLVAKHSWDNQFIYLQVTRGIQMQRDHMPADCLTPTLYAYSNPLKAVSDDIIKNGIKAITLDDIRWLNCDIKAITLLPNVMLKLACKHRNADDAILIAPNGNITEGTASNVFIVKNNTLLTPPNSSAILPGITRLLINRIAKAHGITVLEQNLTLDDLTSADEIWLASSTKEALPITQLNDLPVGSGKPGALWQLMRQHYQTYKHDFVAQYLAQQVQQQQQQQ